MRKNFLHRNAITPPTPPPSVQGSTCILSHIGLLPLPWDGSSRSDSQQRLSRYKTKGMEQGPGNLRRGGSKRHRLGGLLVCLGTAHRREGGHKAERQSAMGKGSGCPPSASHESAALSKPLPFPSTPLSCRGQQAAGVTGTTVQARSSPPVTVIAPLPTRTPGAGLPAQQQ